MEIASRLRDYTGLPQATKAISYVLGQYSRVQVGVFFCITWVRWEGCWFRALVEGLALAFYMDFAPSSEYNKDGSGMAQIRRPVLSSWTVGN